MATPAFSIQTQAITVTKGTPGSVTIPTKDVSGTVVDVSAGYTLGKLTVQPSSNVNPLFADIDLTADVSAAFSTTGVTLSWTAAQASTIAAALPVINNTFGLSISNDAGTTKSLIGLAGLNLANTANLGN